MASDSPATCPGCGQPAAGRFCGNCGAAVSCGACGEALGPGVRFCGSCGAAAGAGAPASSRNAWRAGPAVFPLALAAIMVVAALVVYLVRRDPSPSLPLGEAMAFGPASAEPAPLLDGLSGRDRFDTLYNRVMRASERGDGATVNRFAPQALQAYRELEEPDIDARYHAAMLRLHTGDPAGAVVLADTITGLASSHLFGFVIRGTVARLQGDSARLSTEQGRLLQHYDAEMAAGRYEYAHHKFILDQFVGEARQRAAGSGGRPPGR